MSEKSAAERKAQADIERLEAEIDLMEAKMKSKGAEAEIELKSELEQYKAKRDEARAQLEKLKQSGEGAWKDVKEGLDSALDELSTAFKKAKDRF